MVDSRREWLRLIDAPNCPAATASVGRVPRDGTAVDIERRWVYDIPAVMVGLAASGTGDASIYRQGRSPPSSDTPKVMWVESSQ